MSFSPATVVAHRDGTRTERPDSLADEAPVALVFNGISQAVMFATPDDLEDFALGFALTEGFIESPRELYGVEIVRHVTGIELQLEVAAACEMRLKSRRRTLAGRTGCGLCGIESLGQLERALPAVPRVCIETGALAAVQRALASHQVLNRLTGATHAAAWCAPDGDVQMVREDVGRHNALDKLIGAMLRAAVDRRDGFVWISSRASHEIIHKAALAGVGLVAATSAPTALAVRDAAACGLALAGFVRGDDWVAYTFADRFTAARRTR